MILIIVVIAVIALWINRNTTNDAIKMSNIISDLSVVLKSVDPSHGIVHAITVMQHANCILESAIEEGYNFTYSQTLTIVLAALLHDADDRKFFINSKNASTLLKRYFPSLRKDVLDLISLVSASSNGNKQDQNRPWSDYIPRYSDRLEGFSIERCIQYSKTQNRPFSIPATERATDRQQLYLIASPERFERYQTFKNSVSVIDHIYDKLLHLAFHTGIPYIDNEINNRHNKLEAYALEFGRTGEPPEIIDTSDLQKNHKD